MDVIDEALARVSERPSMPSATRSSFAAPTRRATTHPGRETGRLINGSRAMRGGDLIGNVLLLLASAIEGGSGWLALAAPPR